MSYRDLPPDLGVTPLSDARLAEDVVDLILEPDARMAGCLGVMICSPQDIGLAPVVVDDVPPDADAAKLAHVLRTILSVVGAEDGAVIVGRGRPGSFLLTDADREWHEVLLAVCRETGTRLLGAFVATPSAVRPFPPPLAAVAS